MSTELLIRPRALSSPMDDKHKVARRPIMHHARNRCPKRRLRNRAQMEVRHMLRRPSGGHCRLVSVADLTHK